MIRWAIFLLSATGWAQGIPLNANGMVHATAGGSLPAVVQSTSCTWTSGSNECALTFPGSYTAGNAIFVVGQTNNGDTLSIAQTGNAYTLTVNRDDAAFANTYLWQSCNVAGGSNKISITSGGSIIAHAVAIEVSGLSASCADKNTSSTYSFAAPTTGTTAATTTANELIVAGFGYAVGDPSTTCAGYTQAAQINDSGQNRSVVLNYKIVSATGTQACTQSGGGTYAGSGVIGTFK